MNRIAMLAAGAALLTAGAARAHEHGAHTSAGVKCMPISQAPSSAVSCVPIAQAPSAQMPSAQMPSAQMPSAQMPSAQTTQRCVPTGRCDQVRVNFAFNSAELDDSAKQVLDRAASCLENNRGLQVAVEGSADQRGSEAYNKKLGQERADSVAAYLESKGVPSQQLTTESFGKDRPICRGMTETCFSQNRNVTIVSKAPVAVR